MATWQFTIELLPSKWAEAHCYDASSLYGDDEFYDRTHAWLTCQPHDNFQATLSEILPPAESYSEDWLVWGDDEVHDIQVGYENNKVESISIRLALNERLREIIEKIVQFAQTANCVLFFPEFQKVIDPTVIELIQAIKKSSAYAFVLDPEEYLSRF